MAPVRIYLAPGMFGFATLAAYDYFKHVAAALRARFRARGQELQVRVCPVHPTASIRRRATKLVKMLEQTAGNDGGPIHLIGHSTGGLDARLVTSPSVHLGDGDALSFDWLPRLRSVTTISTPHFGTPLASFFATAKGQRLLYAITAITVTALKLGAPPLATASALLASLGRTNELMGVEVALVDRITDTVLAALDEASSRDLRAWLRQVRDDQGGVVQLMPEAMDVFQAGVEDHPDIRYQCVASYVPPVRASQALLAAARSPYSLISGALFRLMSGVTKVQDDNYPCWAADRRHDEQVVAMCGELPPRHANDGVVPFYSQLWGQLCWAGHGDHLDVVGHFPGRGDHNDWLASGAGFDAHRFETLMDRVVVGLIEAQS